MPIARISTTDSMSLLLDVSKLAAQVLMIEKIYHISVARFSGEYHEDTTNAVFHGLEENIRQFIKDEEGVSDEEVDNYIAQTVEAEVPFWNVGVMDDYLTANGWHKRSSAPTKIDLRANRTKLTFTKFTSPTKAVLIEIPTFSDVPEEITVYVVDNEGEDFTPGEQFLKESPLHPINLEQVVETAEKFLLVK